MSEPGYSGAGEALGRMWALLGGDPAQAAQVSFTGPEQVLPAVHDVTSFAAATVGAATLAVAELAAVRRGDEAGGVTVDRRAAAAAFRAEALFRPIGWELPPIWDPLAGDYRAADGWVRLHTNYAYHRDAALDALGLPRDGDRERVAAVVAGLPAREVEDRVVAAGGCAAAMRTAAEWAAHPHGRALAAVPAVEVRAGDPAAADPALTRPARDPAGSARARPLAGVRVLDLTRVIAGPVGAVTLAAWGAEVLRIDPPGFVEVPALPPITTTGKHCAALDLRAPADRARFEDLVRQAHVVVHGLRPGALDALGYGVAGLRALNPALVLASVDAYGRTGPWAGRRGFDSLVQMSTGIAAAGAAAAGADRPVPLPAQALDHGTGYLLAAAVCRGLTRLLTQGRPVASAASLAGVAGLLTALPAPEPVDPPEWDDDDTVAVPTTWGAARAVPVPGRIEGEAAPEPAVTAGPLARHRPAFEAALETGS